MKTFNDVIKCVENSNLNYYINKTPFSANIAIKSSFIKRFEETSLSEPKVEEFYESDTKKLKQKIFV